MNDIQGYNLLRNDSQSMTSRPSGGMAVFSRVEFLPGYPSCRNLNGVESNDSATCYHRWNISITNGSTVTTVGSIISGSDLIKFSI